MGDNKMNIRTMHSIQLRRLMYATIRDNASTITPQLLVKVARDNGENLLPQTAASYISKYFTGRLMSNGRCSSKRTVPLPTNINRQRRNFSRIGVSTTIHSLRLRQAITQLVVSNPDVTTQTIMTFAKSYFNEELKYGTAANYKSRILCGRSILSFHREDNKVNRVQNVPNTITVPNVENLTPTQKSRIKAAINGIMELLIALEREVS
jgi:hypothetical protein